MTETDPAACIRCEE